MVRRVDTQIRLEADVRDAERGLGRVADQARRLSGDFDRAFGRQTTSQIDRLTDRLSGASGLGSALGGLGGPAAIAAAGIAATGTAAAVAARELFDLATRTAEQVRLQRQFADNLGVSIERFSALTAVARRYGADAEDVSDVLKDLSVRAIENEREFTELGISIRDVNGEILQGIPLFERVADGIRAKTNATEQASAADILASDAGVRLVEVLRLGSTEIRRQTEEIVRNGEAIGETTAQINREFTRALQDAQVAVDGLTTAIGTRLAGVLTPLVEQFTDAVRGVRSFQSSIEEAVNSDAFRSYSELMGDLVEVLSGRRAARGLGRLLTDAGTRAEALPTEGVPEGIAREGVPSALDPRTFGAGRVQGLGGEGGGTRGGGRGRRRLGGAGGVEGGNGVPALFFPEQDELDQALERMREHLDQQAELREQAQERIVEAERRAAAERQRITEQLARRRQAQEEASNAAILSNLNSFASSSIAIAQNIAGESARSSEAFFVVQQGIQAVQAGINTAVAITRALSDLGPIAGPPAAVAIGLAGAAQVAAILTARPGSPPSTTGAPALAGIGARATAPSPPSPDARFGPEGVAATSGPTQTFVTFSGPTNSRRARRELEEVLA